MPLESLPAAVLDAAGLQDARMLSVGRGDRVWIVDDGASTMVLRRCEPETAAWLHPCLTRLGGRFPVPRPTPVFAGRSLLTVHGESWEALDHLPGHEVGWDERPGLEEVGEFLAGYHEVSLRVTSGYRPRPGGTPLMQLGRLVDREGAVVTMGSVAGADDLLALVESFERDLENLRYSELPACVVHGDPTTFNVLADGEPPKPVGLIDFELADVEAAVADIASCLWRSGRPSQLATELDAGRVRALLVGYQSVRPLSDAETAALPVLLRGRGLQMLVKRTRLRLADPGPYAELRWITAHADELATESA